MNPQAPTPNGPIRQGGGIPTPTSGAPLPPRPLSSPQMQPTFQQPAAAPPPLQPAVVGGPPAGRPMGKPPVHTNPNSTQNTLQIAEIRDGIVILNDGSFRSVVMVKSINFDLMSPQEQ